MNTELKVLVLLMATAGLGLVAYAVTGFIAPEWAAVHLWPLLATGGFVPVILALGWGVRMWQRIGADIWLDRVRAKAQELANKARELELRAVEAVTATDDDEPGEDDEAGDAQVSDPAERRRYFEIAHWHVFFRRLWAAGTSYGWDIRTLTATGAVTRVTTQPGWNIGTNQLRLAGYLHKDMSGTRPLVTDEAWQRDRLWEKVPCPSGEPPDIVPPPYTKQQTPHETAAKQAGAVIVDG